MFNIITNITFYISFPLIYDLPSIFISEFFFMVNNINFLKVFSYIKCITLGNINIRNRLISYLL